jgi:competence CoiA-like predicted nuclease
MKYALIGDERIEATKGAKGVCPSCGSILIAKCGDLKVNHWSHKGNRNCDQWWENETEWHRAWKGQFPDDWQEVVHKDKNGEKHIADVKTESGWVLKFQHSYLKPEESRSRNAFYK